MELQIPQEHIDRLLTGFETGFQEALHEIAAAEECIRADLESCRGFAEALAILAKAAVQSDTASLAAALSRKAITDAHRTAVGPESHSDDCPFFV